MQRELSGKRAILTGASGGIGRAIAEALVKAGVRLAIASRNADALNQLAESLRAIGGDVLVVPTDITKPDDRKRLVDATVEKFGGLDLLVNNAGIGSHGHFATSTPEIMRQVMEVNFFGPVELTRLAIPHLMKGNHPVVVNLTSMCGRKGMPAWPEYSASKHALVGMSEAWRGEFTRFGVDVVTLVPGLTNSGFGGQLLRRDGKLEIPFNEGMKPVELAAGIVRAIQKNSREVVFGGEAKRLLTFNRFFPRLTNWLIARKVKKLYANQ
ncbi:MAG: short chain dehydrogenase [Planctomycetaceae bacterium]|nr:short chain dehydrogenase [Planctomycetaceae bacterium]